MHSKLRWSGPSARFKADRTSCRVTIRTFLGTRVGAVDPIGTRTRADAILLPVTGTHSVWNFSRRDPERLSAGQGFDAWRFRESRKTSNHSAVFMPPKDGAVSTHAAPYAGSSVETAQVPHAGGFR